MEEKGLCDCRTNNTRQNNFHVRPTNTVLKVTPAVAFTHYGMSVNVKNLLRLKKTAEERV